MKLHQAFEIVRGDVVAFVGAGGKTSTLIALGRELSAQGWRVLATTTTRIGEDQLRLMPHTMYYHAAPDAISSALTEHQFVFLYETIQRQKVYGPNAEWLRQLLDTVDSDVLLIEADGARGMPFKAPFEHEPVIPQESSLVIPVVSLSVLGQPFDEAHVYNPQAMTEKYGFFPGTRVKSPWVAQVLRDEELGLRGVPDHARVVALLNHTPERGYLRGRARLIARLALQSPRIDGVVLGTVGTDEPIYEVQRTVGAVVLAAGMSTRMGVPKVLLPWGEQETIIGSIVDKLTRARVEPIIVVTGHQSDAVKAALQSFDVKFVYNRAYKTGEMLSSLKAGLKAMPAHISAAMVVLGDQPRLEPKVIYQVLNAYAEGKGTIVAPSFEQRRGHPILISRRYWPELAALDDGGAPRDVINAHQDQIAYVDVDTDSVLRDVDTPEDYDSERRRAGLPRISRPGTPSL